MFRTQKIAILTLAAAALFGPMVAYAQQENQQQTTAAMVHKTDLDADAALNRLYAMAPDARDIVAGAKGVLIFPEIHAGGAILGVEYGHGVLRSADAANIYYNATTASIGAQLGFESKSVILIFLTEDALDHFRKGNSWTAGVDASIALLKVGASGKIDTNTTRSSIDAFVVTNKGLMVDVLSLSGTRFTKAPL